MGIQQVPHLLVDQDGDLGGLFDPRPGRRAKVQIDLVSFDGRKEVFAHENQKGERGERSKEIASHEGLGIPH